MSQHDPLANPHINRRALLAMRAELDDRSWRREVLGEWIVDREQIRERARERSRLRKLEAA